MTSSHEFLRAWDHGAKQKKTTTKKQQLRFCLAACEQGRCQNDIKIHKQPFCTRCAFLNQATNSKDAVSCKGIQSSSYFSCFSGSSRSVPKLAAWTATKASEGVEVVRLGTWSKQAVAKTGRPRNRTLSAYTPKEDAGKRNLNGQ